MNKITVILGQTAVGKTKFAIEFAKKNNGEIISCDSMQIYKYMDIGTAKPTDQEMQDIPHHMMNIIQPDETFSVARYKKMATSCIDDVLSRDKHPIIVGGTGLYINSLIYNINYADVTYDAKFRQSLWDEAKKYGNDFLHQKLLSIDKEAAKRIHVNDLKRIIRAIEIYAHTGKSIIQHEKNSKLKPPIYDFNIIGLSMDRQSLYERINERVDKMFQNGFIDEVHRLIFMGYDKGQTSMQAIGYREVLAYLEGQTSLSDAIELIKINSRKYAKRQGTWFRKIDSVNWINSTSDPR